MSASDALDEEIGRYGTIVVVGGGCYGQYYVRQLRRAARAGALSADRVLVVDHDSNCLVARQDPEPGDLPIELRIADWRQFFREYLDAAVESPENARRDAIVPSPLMPHLMGEWLVGTARERFGARVSADVPFDRLPDVPWERAGAPGTHFVSFATWMCPVNCVEPRTCPHTREARSWSLPVAITRHTERETQAGRPLIAATLFCRHRAYGVGMFDTSEVIAAHDRIVAAGDAGPAEIVIGTVSHCHGALTRLLLS